MESTISCTGSYDAIGILYCHTNVGGAFGFVRMRTVWMLVSPQSRESFAKEFLYLCRTSLSPCFMKRAIFKQSKQRESESEGVRFLDGLTSGCPPALFQ